MFWSILNYSVWKEIKSTTSVKLQADILLFITHPLILVRLYWLRYVTWSKITRRLSRNNLRLRRYLCLRLFLSKRNKAGRKKPAQEFNLLFFYYFTWKKLVLQSLMIVTLKSWSHMLFREVQKSQQNMPSTSLKVKKVTSRISVFVLRKLILSHFIK